MKIQSLHLRPQSTASAHIILTPLHYMASLFPKTGPRWTTSSVTTYRITTGTQQKYQKYVSM